MTVGLVIFDCDGVLVDSETISCSVYSEVLARHGYAITPRQVMERFLGRTDREARATIEAELGRSLPTLDAEIAAATHAHYHTSLTGIPGVADAVRDLGLPVCVASSGTPAKIRHGLTCTGLIDLFAPHLFSASQVARGKPAPDLFLFAAAQMDVAPQRCLVIEDSIAGVQAARAGGMRAIGFCGGSHCRPDHALHLCDAGAFEIATEMSQCAEIISELAFQEAAFHA